MTDEFSLPKDLPAHGYSLGGSWSPGHKSHTNADTGEFWEVNSPCPSQSAVNVQRALLARPDDVQLGWFGRLLALIGMKDHS